MIYLIKQLWLASLLLSGGLPPYAEDSIPGLRTSWVVFSDPHYLDPSLCEDIVSSGDTSGENLKLLVESDAILKEAVQMTLRSGAELVLIPGDLTGDGKMVSHMGFADHLAFLEEQGMQVYVIPGNHDIRNTGALSPDGNMTNREEYVDAARFREIYAPYGYGEAILRDSFSLSYVAEPVDGLWIVGLDPSLSHLGDPSGHPAREGEIGRETIRWLAAVMELPGAREKRKIVIMHYGVLEHFRGQKRYFSRYVVNDHKRVARLLAELGVKVVLTGHFHANDITLKKWTDDTFLFDVETGSLVTYPCPLRRIEIAGDSMHIETLTIASIPSVGENFSGYARHAAEKGVSSHVEQFLLSWHFRPKSAEKVAFQIGEAFAAHCEGDEIPRYPPVDVEGLCLLERFLVCFRKRMVREMYNDLPPPDNNISINLQSGTFR